METILEVIRQRRSVREFADTAPDTTHVSEVIEAARWAPSGHNNQPWRFMVVSDKNIRYGLARFTTSGYIIKGAPVAIVVCLDHRDSYNREKDIMAIGAAIQNMLLCAHSMGLGACWLGEILNKKDEVAKYLGLARDQELMAVIALGYPRGGADAGERRPVDDLLLTPPHDHTRQDTP